MFNGRVKTRGKLTHAHDHATELAPGDYLVEALWSRTFSEHGGNADAAAGVTCISVYITFSVLTTLAGYSSLGASQTGAGDTGVPAPGYCVVCIRVPGWSAF